MDIVYRCKVYPLDRFLKPHLYTLNWLPELSVDDKRKPVRFLHIVEKSMGLLDRWKASFLRQLLDQNDPATVLVIDAISIWSRMLPHKSESQVHYLNNPSILQFSGLVGFLAQLCESPDLALRSRCDIHASLDAPLKTVILDNLSAYYFQENASLETLRKLLETLHATLGCAVVTFGYGIEYYEGVDNTYPTRPSEIKGPWPTRLDYSYLKAMDSVLVFTQDKN
ncbi:Psy3p Ecym_2772 [Eremothecium cymbalariae DBVPG|uniref:DNA recombination and repair protein Rad51-like C-terminal domain-containing protein n=1 Tax=Eremothecium cymbalariae (strain CBS 270.75 / DBVPG 7215 / KCTC 17166 / NRRL Y-17582) TaxID=931890 RepID=G8JQ08_ERECY|nr:Hypothetical protein Ecym_2772 [Eremothecium cymbalariae DBVPG\